jgi:hypothetical protein
MTRQKMLTLQERLSQIKETKNTIQLANEFRNQYLKCTKGCSLTFFLSSELLHKMKAYLNTEYVGALSIHDYYLSDGKSTDGKSTDGKLTDDKLTVGNLYENASQPVAYFHVHSEHINWILGDEMAMLLDLYDRGVYTNYILSHEGIYMNQMTFSFQKFWVTLKTDTKQYISNAIKSTFSNIENYISLFHPTLFTPEFIEQQFNILAQDNEFKTSLELIPEEEKEQHIQNTIRTTYLKNTEYIYQIFVDILQYTNNLTLSDLIGTTDIPDDFILFNLQFYNWDCISSGIYQTINYYTRNKYC